jgi:hypothetical protein
LNRSPKLTRENYSSWGIDFYLAVITQGYNTSYDGTTQTWDTNFTQTTNAYVDNREDKSRPILWIWNNSHSENNKKWGGTSGLNHWEGLEPQQGPMPPIEVLFEIGIWADS